MPALATITALLLTPPGTPAGGFHWQRIITPPPGAGTQQACVVLDAATFANAAPALRDLRLFQDGTELPYVVEESYDERALNSGTTPDDDRSLYEPVYVARMQPRPPGTAAAGFPSHPPSDETLLREAPYGYYAATFVQAHVPVERVRLDPAPSVPVHVSISAWAGVSAPPYPADNRSNLEVQEHTFDPTHPAWAFTLGANLQTRARVTISDETPGPRSERVILEMRRRSLCYQPRSTNPLVLYLGGGAGIAAKTYGLANGFSTGADRPYATMGPLEPNPDQQHTTKLPVSRLLIAVAILGATLLLTIGIALELLRKEKSRPKAAHS